MTASHQEVERDLEVIGESVALLRDATIYGGAAQTLTGWGLAWLVGFIGTWWLETRGITDWRITLLWNPCVLFGFVMTWRAFARYPIVLASGWRLGAAWGIIFAFAYLWMAVLWPMSPYQLLTFFSTLIMLAWAVLGLILNNWLWMTLGTAIGMMMGSGYLVVGAKPELWLWHAIFGGGSMLVAAIILRAMGKSRGQA